MAADTVLHETVRNGKGWIKEVGGEEGAIFGKEDEGEKGNHNLEKKEGGGEP